ncbi:hypothetical protein NPJ88_000140 [Halomonas elongata]|uniref:hypothetical protein n=1 Tax=Halomonas elongata TaxID=2746 RepID=UPI00255ADE9C|nr:hypothetical protein [Halomonas elongata]MDL4860731.1 hypothetical protein [Halomonas elongata]
MPLIITVAVFRQDEGEVVWDLLPMTAEILDGVATQHHREGAVTDKVHEGTHIPNVLRNIEKMLATPVAEKTSLVVFCQNGSVAEKFLDEVRKDARLDVVAR